MIDSKEIAFIIDFCYLGSLISEDSICDRDIRKRIGKEISAYGRLSKIWKNNGYSARTKKLPHEADVVRI